MLVIEESCIDCKFFKAGATLRHEYQRGMAGASEVERFMSYRCGRCGYEGYRKKGSWTKCPACHSTRIGERGTAGTLEVKRRLSYRCGRCGYEGYWRTGDSGNWPKCAACHSTRIGWLEW